MSWHRSRCPGQPTLRRRDCSSRAGSPSASCLDRPLRRRPRGRASTLLPTAGTLGCSRRRSYGTALSGVTGARRREGSVPEPLQSKRLTSSVQAGTPKSNASHPIGAMRSQIARTRLTHATQRGKTPVRSTATAVAATSTIAATSAARKKPSPRFHSASAAEGLGGRSSFCVRVRHRLAAMTCRQPRVATVGGRPTLSSTASSPPAPEPPLGRRHHLYAQQGGMALPRCRPGSLPPDRRLGNGRSLEGRACHRRAADGARPQATPPRADLDSNSSASPLAQRPAPPGSPSRWTARATASTTPSRRASSRR